MYRNRYETTGIIKLLIHEIVFSLHWPSKNIGVIPSSNYPACHKIPQKFIPTVHNSEHLDTEKS